MDKIRFSENEKKIFLMIKDGQSLSRLEGVTMDSAITAVQYLEDNGLVVNNTRDRGIFSAEITHKGRAYLEEYPTLDNPINDKIKELQLNKLEYQKKIRKQESIIRYWKLANIITGVVGIIIGIITVKFVR